MNRLEQMWAKMAKQAEIKRHTLSVYKSPRIKDIPSNNVVMKGKLCSAPSCRNRPMKDSKFCKKCTFEFKPNKKKINKDKYIDFRKETVDHHFDVSEYLLTIRLRNKNRKLLGLDK